MEQRGTRKSRTRGRPPRFVQPRSLALGNHRACLRQNRAIDNSEGWQVNHGWNIEQTESRARGLVGQDPRTRFWVYGAGRLIGRIGLGASERGLERGRRDLKRLKSTATAGVVMVSLIAHVVSQSGVMRCSLRYRRRRHQRLQRARGHPRRIIRRNLTERCDNGRYFAPICRVNKNSREYD